MSVGLGGIDGGADRAPRQTSVAAAERGASTAVDDPTPSTVRQAPSEATPATPAAAPAPSLAALVDKARAAQAELAGQPLPITNHHHRFIMNMFGG